MPNYHSAFLNGAAAAPQGSLAAANSIKKRFPHRRNVNRKKENFVSSPLMKMTLVVIFICLISGLFGVSGNFLSVLEAVRNFTVQIFSTCSVVETHWQNHIYGFSECFIHML